MSNNDNKYYWRNQPSNVWLNTRGERVLAPYPVQILAIGMRNAKTQLIVNAKK